MHSCQATCAQRTLLRAAIAVQCAVEHVGGEMSLSEEPVTAAAEHAQPKSALPVTQVQYDSTGPQTEELQGTEPECIDWQPVRIGLLAVLMPIVMATIAWFSAPYMPR